MQPQSRVGVALKQESRLRLLRKVKTLFKPPTTNINPRLTAELKLNGLNAPKCFDYLMTKSPATKPDFLYLSTNTVYTEY